MCKTIFNELLDHPFLTSIFISDLLILAFHKPPFIFALLMLGVLMGISMYFGQRLALFKECKE